MPRTSYDLRMGVDIGLSSFLMSLESPASLMSHSKERFLAIIIYILSHSEPIEQPPSKVIHVRHSHYFLTSPLQPPRI